MARRLLILGCLAGLLSLPAWADDLPHRRPGLWSVTTPSVGGGQAPRDMRMCIDAATDAALLNMGQSMANCSKPDIHRSGDTLTVDSACNVSGSAINSHTVITVSGDTAYHSVSSATMVPPVAGMGNMTHASDGKWVGACPAGMKPGDVIVNGRTFNALDMPKRP
jgi:hypothetical protein